MLSRHVSPRGRTARKEQDQSLGHTHRAAAPADRPLLKSQDLYLRPARVYLAKENFPVPWTTHSTSADHPSHTTPVPVGCSSQATSWMKVRGERSEGDSGGCSSSLQEPFHRVRVNPTLLSCSPYSKERQLCSTWVAVAAIKGTQQGKDQSKGTARQDSTTVETGLQVWGDVGREATEPSVLGGLPRHPIRLSDHQCASTSARSTCPMHSPFLLLGEVNVQALSHTTVKVGTQQPENQAPRRPLGPMEGRLEGRGMIRAVPGQ